MPLNRRSRLNTHGVARAPTRAMLRAVGFGESVGLMTDGRFSGCARGLETGHVALAKYFKLASTASRGAVTD